MLDATPGTLVGRVVHGPAGDQPLAGVSVRLFDRASNSYVTGTVTRSNGYYTITGIQPGEYLAQFVDPGKVFLATWFGWTMHTSSSTVITIPPGGRLWASAWLGAA